MMHHKTDNYTSIMSLGYSTIFQTQTLVQYYFWSTAMQKWMISVEEGGNIKSANGPPYATFTQNYDREYAKLYSTEMAESSSLLD